MTDAAIAEVVGRSEAAVSAMRQKYGIYKDGKRRRDEMTEYENTFMMQNHTAMTTGEMARALGRNVASIRTWLYNRGLSAKSSIKKIRVTNKITGEVTGGLNAREAAALMGLKAVHSVYEIQANPNHRRWKVERE